MTTKKFPRAASGMRRIAAREAGNASWSGAEREPSMKQMRSTRVAALALLAWLGLDALATRGARRRRAAQARRRPRRHLGVGALVGRLHGGTDPGGARQGHRRRRHRRRRALRLRRERSEPDLPVLADGRGAERYASALSVHEDLARHARPGELAKRAKELADDGAIDPLAELAHDNVYLYSGNEDETVDSTSWRRRRASTRSSASPRATSTLVEGEGGHAFLTDAGRRGLRYHRDAVCSDCDYDQAKAILSWIYGPLAEASATPPGKFILFDQGAFAEPGDGFADEGVVYVPPGCAEQPGCRVHIALHGCEQSREAVGDAFVKDSGYAEVADTNRLIVLFPQAKASTVNPKGCWDWWGYTGLDYLGKDAPQIKAIWSMVEQLAQAPKGRRDGAAGHRGGRGAAWLGALSPGARAARGHPAAPARAHAHRGGAGRRCGAPTFLRAVARPRGRLGLASSRSARRCSSSGRWPWPRSGSAEAIGGQLLSHAEDWAPDRRLPPHGAQRAARRRGLLRGFGYLAEGEPFDENTVPHVRMTKRLG